MKTIKINLKNKENIKIIPISDVHLGSKQCDIDYFKSIIEEIRLNDNTYTILNGDIIDNTLKSSVGNVYENELTPMAQLELAINLLGPIKNKILLISDGNHERRTEKETNIDISYLIAKQLGIVERYAKGFWYLFLHFGEKEKGRKAPMLYTICGYHGCGGGRMVGGKTNRLVDMSNVAIADLYVMGHTHTPVSTKKSIYMPEYGNQVCIEKELHYLMTNSFLKNGGYGESFGFHPTSNSACSAELNARRRNIKVTI